MIRVYIAGPMRGQRYFNFPAFDAARDMLAADGYVPVSPADIDRENGFDPTKLPEDSDWVNIEDYGLDLVEIVRRDLEALVTCDAIYMLPNWEKSRGARTELAVAEWMGLDVWYQFAPVSVDVLEEARLLVRGDRQNQYGPPDQDFTRTAGMWNAMWQHKLRDGEQLEPFDVALAMVALKLSRQQHQRKRDNWVDICGYGYCGSVCDEQAAKRIAHVPGS